MNSDLQNRQTFPADAIKSFYAPSSLVLFQNKQLFLYFVSRSKAVIFLFPFRPKLIDTTSQALVFVNIKAYVFMDNVSFPLLTLFPFLFMSVADLVSWVRQWICANFVLMFSTYTWLPSWVFQTFLVFSSSRRLHSSLRYFIFHQLITKRRQSAGKTINDFDGLKSSQQQRKIPLPNRVLLFSDTCQFISCLKVDYITTISQILEAKSCYLELVGDRIQSIWPTE